MSAPTPEKQESLKPSRRRHSMWFFISAALAVFVLIIAGVLAYDEKLQPADDLLPRRPVPKPEENGWVLHQQLWGAVPEVNRKDRELWFKVITGQTPWDERLAAKLVAGREALLTDLGKVLTLSEYQWPPLGHVTSASEGLESPRLISERYAAAQADILLLARQGNADEALRHVRQLVEAHRRRIAGCALPYALFSGFSSAHTVMAPANYLIAQDMDAGDAAWAALQNACLNAETSRDDMSEILRHNFQFLWVNRDAHPGGGTFEPFAKWPRPLRSALFKKNKTLNEIANLFRAAEQLCMQPTATREESLWGLYDDEQKGLTWRDIAHPNAVGRETMRRHSKLPIVLDGYARRHNAILRLMALRIALHRWQLKHGGQFPETLEALVPEFIAEIPADPYDGKPLRWVPGESVYALGQDWRDNVPVFKEGWIDSEFDHPGIRLGPVPAGGSSDAE